MKNTVESRFFKSPAEKNFWFELYEGSTKGTGEGEIYV